jgi:hypothetical protein
MTVYHVIDKATGAKVYEYEAAAPVEWAGFEFATHDHVAQAAPEAPADTTRAEDWHINVGPFYDRFGAYKLPILASADPLVQAVIKDTTVRKYIDLKGRRAELSQALGLLRAKGFPVTDAAVLDVQPTSAEVYRG